MVQAPSKPVREKPWDAYRGEPGWKLTIPGWGGSLDDAELAYV
jgi:hypothetical protein